MENNLLKSQIVRNIFITIILLFLSHTALYSQSVKVQGVVRDSVSGAPIEFATVRFDGTSIGGLTDEKGRFSLINASSNNNILVISLMGYESRRISINKTTQLDIKLKEEGIELQEIVVRPKKEKYSKKNNPAVELIKKVIAHKNDYLVTDQDYYSNDEYERLMFAVNDYKKGKGVLKNMKFLSKYTTTSKIDNKTILPFSVRETASNVYYRKNPKGTRRVITGHKSEGIDQAMDAELLDGVINEIFQDFDIRDNTIHMLLTDFVGPLNSISSVDFYRWYIIDTVQIDQKKYVNLGFVPFNTRDAGFIGNIYVKPDSTYAIKQISFRVSSKINVNYLDELLVTQDFKELSPFLWVPEKITTAMDLSILGFGKVYVEKIRDFNNFIFNLPVDAIFESSSPIIYLSDYKKRQNDFWDKNRPTATARDLKMGDMMKELESNKLIKVTLKTIDILTTNYIATNKDEDKNKVDLGTTLTFYSYNRQEGNRFRLTAATTSHFHPHLFLYGYGAYGTRDEKFKYYGEATWAFNKRDYHKDEFPRNNLTIGYKYDINTLGQRFLQAERDNILLSIGAKNYNNLTYSRMAEISYLHEYYNGFSFGVSGKNYNEIPAGSLKFEYKDKDGIITDGRNLKTTEVTAFARMAFKEKFFQQRRKRHSLPSEGLIANFTHTLGLKNVLGGQYNYNKSILTLDKEFWIAPYGRIGVTLKGEKVWGTVPFPLLLTANANSSITIQRGSYYMLRPMEFMNDSQLSWDINYQLGGWLFNRIPLLKLLKWREILGFRGVWGRLSKKNDPEYNRNLIVFPEDTYRMTGAPYMEYSIGIQNILQFFRVDYVRRINYLNHPGIDRDGFRISFDMNF